MLRIEHDNQRFASLETATPGTLSGRYDLSELIFNSPDEFFGEIGQRLFLIGKDVQPSEAVPTRMDLLALDEAGQAVIIIVQRDDEPSSLARAITCAGLIAQWEPSDFFSRLSERQTAQLRTFLRVPSEEMNRDQRTILIGEVFDFEVLTAAKWLWERNHMDNVCVRIYLTVDRQTGTEYVGCSDISEEGTLPIQESPHSAAALSERQPRQLQESPVAAATPEVVAVADESHHALPEVSR